MCLACPDLSGDPQCSPYVHGVRLGPPTPARFVKQTVGHQPDTSQTRGPDNQVYPPHQEFSLASKHFFFQLLPFFRQCSAGLWKPPTMEIKLGPSGKAGKIFSAQSAEIFWKKRLLKRLNSLFKGFFGFSSQIYFLAKKSPT